MSKKTIKQRIALAAITALTAGVLSVVTSPIANAAAGDLVVELGANAGTGVCAVTKSSGFRSTSAQIVSTLAAPVNVTVAVGGTIGYSKDTGAVSVTWPSNGVMTHATAGTLHSNYGVYSLATGGSTGISGIATQLLTAAAVGTFNVKLYDAAPFSAVNTVNASATQTGVFTVTVVASCSPSVAYSSTYSAVQVSGSYTASPSNTTADVLTYSAGTKAYINIIGKNAYDTALPGSTVWAASATNGAKVSIGTSSSISATTTTDGANSFTSTAAAGTTISVRVGAPSTAAVTTVVTVTADGAPVTTETISFQAEPAKLVLLGQAIGKISSASEGAFAFRLEDAAGNPVAGADVAAITSTYTPRVTSVTVVKQATTVASDMSPSDETANSVNIASIFGTSTSSTSTNGTAKFACNPATSSGSSPITLRFTTPVTEVNVDTVVNLTCAGGVATYTVSTDKAKYNV